MFYRILYIKLLYIKCNVRKQDEESLLQMNTLCMLKTEIEELSGFACVIVCKNTVFSLWYISKDCILKGFTFEL